MSAKVLYEGDVIQRDVDKFSDSARELFETAYSYCVKWLSLGNLFYKGSSLIEYFKSENIFLSWSHWVAIVVPPTVWKLHSWSLPTSRIARGISNLSINVRHWRFWRYLTEVPEEHIYHRMGIVWGYLRTSLLKLGNIALFLLTNLHSNAAEEHTSVLQKLLAQLRPCTVAILKDLKIFYKKCYLIILEFLIVVVLICYIVYDFLYCWCDVTSLCIFICLFI